MQLLHLCPLCNRAAIRKAQEPAPANTSMQCSCMLHQHITATPAHATSARCASTSPFNPPRASSFPSHDQPATPRIITHWHNACAAKIRVALLTHAIHRNLNLGRPRQSRIQGAVNGAQPNVTGHISECEQAGVDWIESSTRDFIAAVVKVEDDIERLQQHIVSRTQRASHAGTKTNA